MDTHEEEEETPDRDRTDSNPNAYAEYSHRENALIK